MLIHYPNTDVTTPIHEDEITQELNYRSYGVVVEEEQIQAGLMGMSNKALLFFGIALALSFVIQGKKKSITGGAGSEGYYD